jgi:hypothetical protein
MSMLEEMRELTQGGSFHLCLSATLASATLPLCHPAALSPSIRCIWTMLLHDRQRSLHCPLGSKWYFPSPVTFYPPSNPSVLVSGGQ